MAIIPQPAPTPPAELKPLAGLELLPIGLRGLNRPSDITMRRPMILDSLTRVSAQAAHDRGIYVRPPVNPVEYSEGNIKKSTEITGVAGYNQRQLPLKDSPDDMSQVEYIQSIQDTTPQNRKIMQAAFLNETNQYFVNKQQGTDNSIPTSHNMVTNLMNMAKAKKIKGAK